MQAACSRLRRQAAAPSRGEHARLSAPCAGGSSDITFRPGARAQAPKQVVLTRSLLCDAGADWRIHLHGRHGPLNWRAVTLPDLIPLNKANHTVHTHG